MWAIIGCIPGCALAGSWIPNGVTRLELTLQYAIPAPQAVAQPIVPQCWAQYDIFNWIQKCLILFPAAPCLSYIQNFHIRPFPFPRHKVYLYPLCLCVIRLGQNANYSFIKKKKSMYWSPSLCLTLCCTPGPHRWI